MKLRVGKRGQLKTSRQTYTKVGLGSFSGVMLEQNKEKQQSYNCITDKK